MRIVYGPIESWRLGRSLGVDPLAVRHKLCPFSCVYCQYGETRRPSVRRRRLVSPAQLRTELTALGEVSADCVTFAGLGEPTLAANLPELVSVVREWGSLPVVILTGSPLVAHPDVQRDLAHFDRVVATLNATDEVLFRRINRPAPGYPYSLAAVVEGLRRIGEDKARELVLQVMLIEANRHAVPQLAALAHRIGPASVQINTPLQPALGGPLSEDEVQTAAQAFAGLQVSSVHDPLARLIPRLG